MKRVQTRLTGIQKERLDLFLWQWLPQALNLRVTRSIVRKLILSGGVYVNRHRVEVPSTSIYLGAVIEVFFDEARLLKGPAAESVPAQFRKEWVLFEDEWLIAVHKPSNLPTQPTLDPSRPNLFRLLGDHLRKTDPKAYLGLHHRLDAGTSGVVLFTRKVEANPGVSKLFSEHWIRKVYQCLAWSGSAATPLVREQACRIDNFLAKSKASKGAKGKALYGSVGSGGYRAITDLQVMEKLPSVLRIEARPQTGRTHQIRVHCAESGHPILGDELYFPKDLVPLRRPTRLMLHALSLEFEHPMTRNLLRVEAPLPAEFTRYLEAVAGRPGNAAVDPAEETSENDEE